MIAVDTSVVVAGLASWHEGHTPARAALARKPRLPAHVALEVYSVLTRLPPPHQVTPALVVAFLEDHFPDPVLPYPAARHLSLLKEASEKGITGGALYDALVADTANHAGATLLTRDRRATRVYEALGVAFQMVD